MFVAGAFSPPFMSSDTDSFSPASEGADRDEVRSPLSEDGAAAAALLDAGRLVDRLVGDESLTSLMRSQGYDAAELQAGVTLQTAAEDLFRIWRQTAVAVVRMQIALSEQWETAREVYLEFRWAARNGYSVEDARGIFQVHESVSPEFQGFLTQAAASYRAAQVLPSSVLAAAGFDAPQLAAALGNLRRLVRLERSLQAGRSRAARCRDERDLAMEMLNLWIREFHRATQRALAERRRPPATAASDRGRKLREARSIRPTEYPSLRARLAWRVPPRGMG